VDPQQLPHLRPQFGRGLLLEQRRTEIEELGVRLAGEGRFGGTQYLGVVLLRLDATQADQQEVQCLPQAEFEAADPR
jgi:hypothetical protein